MKYFKYILSFLLFCMIAVCIGEFYQVHISQYYFTNFFELSNIRAADMQECYSYLLKTAADNHVDFCWTDVDSDMNFIETNVTVYCSQESVSEFIEDVYGIKKGESKSIFLSSGKVEYIDLRDDHNLHAFSALIGREMRFGLIGTPTDMQSFIHAVESRYRIENYSVGNPDWNFYTSMAFYIQFASWLFAYAILFGISLYDMKLMQKELAVRYSLGARKELLFAKKALTDSTYFIASFFLIFGAASKFTESLFSFKLSVLFFTVFLLLNIITVALIFRVDIKKAFIGNLASKSVLSASYMLKLLTSIFLVIALGVGIGQFSKLIELKQQDELLQRYKDYYFIDGMSFDSAADTRDRRTTMLYKLQKEYFGSTVLQSTYIDFKLRDGKTHSGIVCSKNSEAYLREIIPELQGQMLAEKMYVLMPQYKGFEEDLAEITEWAQPNQNGDKGYVFCHEYEVEIIPYAQNVRMLAFDNNTATRTVLCENPVIFFSCLDEQELQIDDIIGSATRHADGIGVTESWTGGLAPTPYTLNLMICIPQAEMSSFASENRFDYSVLNVYENYRQSVARAEKICIMTVTLAILFLILETALIDTVVKLEYSINAKELAVKKILGYSILEKNKKIILITPLVILAGFLGAIAASVALRIATMFWYFLIGCVLLFVIEMLIVVHHIVRTEKSEVVKILKGDS